MSSLRGAYVVMWIERWGARFLKGPQPEIYQMLQLHVGGTDVLKWYSGSETYWQSVQAVLDCFFSGAERAQMCSELIEQALFLEDPGFTPFLHQARAEIRCRELVAVIENAVGIRTSLRSVN